MKIIVIGGTGTIGKKIVSHYSEKAEVIVVGKSSGDFRVDIADSKSIQSLFDQVGKVDAIVCAAGEARWADFDDLSEEDYYIGLKSKLMGQVNLARIGKAFLNDHGSITLTTGILADDPVIKTASAAMVNGAIHSFVRAAALEFPSTIRINAVSSGVVEDAFHKYESYFPGHIAIPMDKMMFAYVKSIEGRISGQVVRVYK